MIESSRDYRCYLSRLPEFVREQYRLLVTDGAKATPVRWSYLSDLDLEFTEEYAEYPNGDGPNFTAAWQDLFDFRISRLS